MLNDNGPFGLNNEILVYLCIEKQNIGLLDFVLKLFIFKMFAQGIQVDLLIVHILGMY